MKSIGIIGAGLSSLYAACQLSKKGYEVHVYDKNSMAGGRSQVFSSDGFLFDMGPSWYWMPDLIDELFLELGEKRSDYYQLNRLNPSYRIYWSDKSHSDVPARKEDLFRFFDTLEENGSEKLKQFLDDAETKYNVAIKHFIEKPGLKLSEVINLKMLKHALRLDVFKSVEKDVYRRFQSEKARSILTFPVLFLGAMPDRIPALYTMMNHADLSLGTWYPDGGMHALAKALETIAINNGVQFHYNSPVDQIIVEEKKAKGLIAGGKHYYFDSILSGADYHHTEQVLLPKEHRKYSEKYWNSREMAPSSLIFYLGVNRRVEKLQHHNLFFDKDLKEHGKTIYDDPKWPEDPLFYVCAPSKTDPSVAPEGMENLFILVPLAPGIEDNQNFREACFEMILERLKEHTGTDIQKNIVFKRSFCASDFKSEYNAFKGNAYGLANTLKQTAYLKPKMKGKPEGLHFCGQLTVPGPGVPPALVSGKIAANQILEEL